MYFIIFIENIGKNSSIMMLLKSTSERISDLTYFILSLRYKHNHLDDDIPTLMSYLESFIQLDFNLQSQISYCSTACIFFELYYWPVEALIVLGPPEYPLFFGCLLIWYFGKGVLGHYVSTALNVKLLTFIDICNTIHYVIWKPRYIWYSLFLAGFE